MYFSPFCVLSKSVYYSLSEESFEDLEATHGRDAHHFSDGEQSPTERWTSSHPFIEDCLLCVVFLTSTALDRKEVAIIYSCPPLDSVH